MRVLWIINITLPEALSLLKGGAVLKSSGGWLLGAAEALVKYNKNISLFIASVSKDVNKLTRLEGENIVYYILPYGAGNESYNEEYEQYWKEVHDAIKPDIVHIHGTEYSHGLAYVNLYGAANVCVSIQGLVSAYYYYYYYGLPFFKVLFSITLSSIIKGGILKGYYNFKKRGEIEKAFIKQTHHIIGRTSWDQARVWAINPDAYYYYGGETLRSIFYEGPLWSYHNCNPYSIFLSQASYPIKGLHMVLKALVLVRRHYPNVSLRVAGWDICRSQGGLELLKISDYGVIIREIIKKYNLKEIVTFTGSLDGDGMKNEYLKCNVFVCPSAIENSPNSLGEAQILGVPVISSFVGGIPDMMIGDEDNLYRFEEIEMLAYKICKVFEKCGNINTEKKRIDALCRHDPLKNTNDLLDTYKKILSLQK